MKHILSFCFSLCMAAAVAAGENDLWMAEAYPDEVSSVVSTISPRQMQNACPRVQQLVYADVSYNVGADPWRAEYVMSGDLTGSTVQWYRYDHRTESQSKAVPYNNPERGTNTPDNFFPPTDEPNTYYAYYFVLTTPGCGNITSPVITVQVGIDDPCMTFKGTTFNIQGGDQKYNMGQTFTLTAYTSAYGGDHHYVWYHNGEPIDTTDHTHYELFWEFNNPTLTVKNATLQDGGTYSISMQDGTECFMYSDPIRVQIGDHVCGAKPVLSFNKNTIAENESATLSGNIGTLEAGETGKLVYMLQPEGSHPSTSLGTWTTDMPGTYNVKYVIENPNFPGCYRESKVVSIVVIGCGPQPTITAATHLMKVNDATTTTTTGLGEYETGKVTYQQDGKGGWNNTWPEGTLTAYSEGEYVLKYEITNSKSAGCTRVAYDTVRVYHCGWGAPQWGTWIADNLKVGTTITPNPSELPSTHWTYKYFYTIDGGKDTVWLANRNSSIYLDTPGKYKIEWTITHAWTDACTQTLVKNITVEPCGTKATIKSNKATMKVGESAKLTVAAVKSGETATLTYSKDGGAAKSQTFSGTTSTFTPTEPGVYTFTYTITVPGCGPNSAQVTVEVYACGPDATVSAQEYVKVGTVTPIIVSTVGAHETGTLTYSKDGGAAQTITTPATWTPTAVGDYKIVWNIKHDKIDCTRSAETVVHVVDCGVPADIRTDHAVLKVGETATLTLSAVAAIETGTVTCSKDGAAATAFSGTTFAPTAAGKYVFTYTVTNTKIDCETSDQVTIDVYACGPDAEISTSKTVYNTTETISITTSAVGSNETGTLTYSYEGGAPVVITNPASWVAPDLGTYVLKWSIKHQYIDCEREATKTIKISDCGDPADIEVDKTVIRLGETLTFTISAVSEAGAVGSVSYTIDGGAAIPFEGTTFTPSQVGQYIFTYIIENHTLGCQTMDMVTINVYDCGPTAEISVTQTDVKLGEVVTITTSAVGDHETGVLSYSLNGGVEQALASKDWTPAAVGTYTLKWAVTHDQIDCARNATVVVNVYACGPDAAVSVGSNALKVGEATTITTSALADRETGILTYSLNGGAPVTVSAGAWTPNEAGTYVFTWSITHDKIDCERSATYTAEAYACGPDATISATTTEVKLLRTTTITVSEVGAHETGTLTYSFEGGAPVTIAPGEWEAKEIGAYVFTWSVIHDKIDCSRSATMSINVIEAELIFDDNNGTHVWSDPKNWWPKYNRIPHERDSGIVIEPCHVDIADAKVEYLYLKLTNPAKQPALTILPTGALTVVNELQNVQNEKDILVRADKTGNGALVLGPKNINIPATVEYFSLAQNGAAKDPVWQYIGYPLQDKHAKNAIYTAPDTRFYIWTNTPNEDVGGNWGEVADNYALPPFSGICLTQNQQMLYTYHGTLCDPLAQTIGLTFTDVGRYPRFQMLANSWVAPIDIAKMENSDFGDADATIYIMNTGTFMEAYLAQPDMSRQGQAKNRGQYNAIPVHAASYIPNSLQVIPPMQGFFVYAPHSGSTNVKLDYAKTIFDAPAFAHHVDPMRAPRRVADTNPVEVMQIRVENNVESDVICMLLNSGFTPQFDNGWDGRKIYGETKVHLAVATADGPMSVAALPELDNTPLIFQGHRALPYSFTVVTDRAYEDLFLWDRQEDIYTPIAPDATYSFTASKDDGERFVIVHKSQSIENVTEQQEAPYKFIWKDHMYIRSGKTIYDASGQLLR